MEHKKVLAAAIVLVIVVAGISIWAVQPKPTDGGGTLTYSCDVTINMKATYDDFDFTADQVALHAIKNWQGIAQATNWKQAQNLDLLVLQEERFVAYMNNKRLAILPENYTVDLEIRFLQNGQVASAIDGGLLSREYSFVVNMPALMSIQTFNQNVTLSGVKAGTYTIQITILSGQYIPDQTGDRNLKTFQFPATFMNP